jgi:ADP-ribosylglycohydrolase
MICAAREQSRITHQDPRCAAGAIAIARGVALAARREPIEPSAFLSDISECAAAEDASVANAVGDLAEWASLNPDDAARHLHASALDPAHADRWQGISAFVTPSVLWSLYAFLRSPDDYWETICVAIGVGGDTDSMAAMAGAMSGARVGPGSLPGALIARITDRGDWGAAQLADLANSCAGLIDS